MTDDARASATDHTGPSVADLRPRNHMVVVVDVDVDVVVDVVLIVIVIVVVDVTRPKLGTNPRL